MTAISAHLTILPNGHPLPPMVNGTTQKLGLQQFWTQNLSFQGNVATFTTPNECVDYLDPTVAIDDDYSLTLDESAIKAGFVKDADGAGVFIGRITGSMPASCYYRSLIPIALKDG